MDNAIKSWLYPCAPRQISQTTSGTSDTYQAAASEYEALHVLVSSVALLVAEGTGASVSASSGAYWPADVPFYFMPVENHESVGYESFDGSTFDGSTVIATVSVIERKR